MNPIHAAVSGGNDGKGNPWPSVLNVMSGGVFVAAGFMHLLPEAQESLEKLSEEFDFEVQAFLFVPVTACLV